MTTFCAIWATIGIVIYLRYFRMLALLCAGYWAFHICAFVVTVAFWPLVWLGCGYCYDLAHKIRLDHAPACQYEETEYVGLAQTVTDKGSSQTRDDRSSHPVGVRQTAVKPSWSS